MQTSRCSACGQPDLRFLEATTKSYSLPPHLLQSNEAVDDENMVSLRRTLEDARRDKFLLERRITFLEGILQKDITNYHSVRSAVHQYHLVVSSFPLRHLPAEIILEIAFWTIDSESGLADVLDCTRGPWPMAQVCKRWREVLLDSSALWSNLSICYNYARPQCAVPLLMTYLERSKTHPLTIGYQAKGVDPRLSATLLGVAVVHSQRWKTLRLQFSSYMLDALRRAKGRMETLEKLDIALAPKETSNGLNLDIFSSAPRLRCLSVVNFPNIDRVVFPWLQLTDYRAIQTHVKEHISVLRQTPNLLECTLTCEGQHRAADISHGAPPIVLPRLMILGLHGSAISVLQAIRAPGLRILLAENINKAVYVEGSFRSFVSACSSLTHLSIPSCIPPDEVLNVLQMDNLLTLNSLRLDLEISGSHSQFGAMMQFLRYKEDPGACVLSELQHISMSVYCSAGSLNIAEIVGMVKSRCKMPETMFSTHHLLRKLRSFELEINHSGGPAFEQLKLLQDEGLDLTLRLR
ncbi:hypothetical protein D9758_014593 [Tetrapyrgos nigripes]|uniref:F-box domain-containing protein n=1 Tax=Tetrapyrgos nigripes TaxID=182062 RepID=A0A8H5C0Q9_9AGAR|nr:hypothetical protein D9758_014593 [Tetrapyrgos nigripes]